MKNLKKHKHKYVVGNIDAYGAVTAKACQRAESHSRYVSGKRWRWCVSTQEFCIIRVLNDGITTEENHKIQDYLVQNGFAVDESFADGFPFQHLYS